MIAHFLTSYHAGRRSCVGALIPAATSQVDTLLTLLQSSLDLDLISREQAFSIWSELWRSDDRQLAPTRALDRAATILEWYAPPGYTFQPWFVRGSVFWGWFPRVG